MGMHVLLVGNPVDGLTVLGPFDTAEDAAVFADDHLRGGYADWWIAPLVASLGD